MCGTHRGDKQAGEAYTTPFLKMSEYPQPPHFFFFFCAKVKGCPEVPKEFALQPLIRLTETAQLSSVSIAIL